jgi:transposase
VCVVCGRVPPTASEDGCATSPRLAWSAPAGGSGCRPPGTARPSTAASLRALARRIQLLDAEVAEHTRAITVLVRAWHPELLTPTGVGPIVAAVVLCAWSHPGRCRTDAAFAMLGGAAPIPASSGQRVRVRLNRSGDRHLNQALHVVVLTRLRYDPTTRAYAQRRRAEGKTNREIRRCLVRYVARQLYRLLEAQPAL